MARAPRRTASARAPKEPPGKTRFKPIRFKLGSQMQHPIWESVQQFRRQVKLQMDEVLQNFELWADHMKKAGPNILFKALKPTFDQSQKICPMDTGELVESGYLEVREFRGKTIVEIGYSRAGKPFYGPIVHERLDFYHTPPEQAKFLQQPLEENMEQIRADILKAYKGVSGA